MYDHACWFRQAAIDALDAAGADWRLALTTPSLLGVWAALRADVGISVRTSYGMPQDIRDITKAMRLPPLPSVDVRMLAGSELSPAASDLRRIVETVVEDHMRQARSKQRRPRITPGRPRLS